MPPTSDATPQHTRVAPRELTPETIARIRQQYADGVPVVQIRSENNISHATLYDCLNGTIAGHPRLPPIPRRKAVRPRKPGDTRLRRSLIAKLWRTAKRQVSEIETRLRATGLQPAERESETRMLAVLVRTLRELSALDGKRDEVRPNTGTEAEDDSPRDMDEFRRELARKMDAFVERRTGAGIPGDAGSA